MNFNLKEIKKDRIILVVLILIVLIALCVYYSTYFVNKRQQALNVRIKETVTAFTSKILEEFKQDSEMKASTAAVKVVDELNTISKNPYSPYDRRMKAYTFEQGCSRCNVVEYSDALSMIVISTFDNKGEMEARTVIKPPSFVSYYKSDNQE